MYRKYFGLHQKPFSITPDPAFSFPSASHKDGLSSLRFGIRERMGFIVLTGEVGIGKTFLIRSLLRELGGDVKRALILNPVMEPDEIFEAILRDLDVPFNETDGIGAKMETFVQFLLKEYNEGRWVVVIIDESQNLTPDALERLRLLTNLETNTSKLLQIIFVGQPELNDVLSLPSIRQLEQRVTVRHQLATFTTEETFEYIKHRLNVAGGTSLKVEFDAAAAKIIHKASGGIPRLIGILCEYALLIAFTQEKRVVNAKIAKEAVRKHSRKEQVCKLPPVNRGIRPFWKWVPLGFSAACLVVTLALAAWVFTGSRQKTDSPQTAKAAETVEQDQIRETTGFSEDENTPEWLLQAVDVEEPNGDWDGVFEASAPEDLDPIEPTSEIWMVEEESEGEVEVVLETSDPPDTEGALIDKEAPVEEAIEVTEEIGEDDPLDFPPPEPAVEKRKRLPVVVPPPPPPPPVSVPAELKPIEMKVGTSATNKGTAAAEGGDFSDEPDPTRRYGVQVASLRALDRARQLADELKQFGPVFLVPWTASDNQTWVRVILGVFEDREDGSEMIQKLNAANLGRDVRIVENRWWQQMPGASGGDVFTLAEE